MATHKCTIYFRSNRERLPAYPGVQYPPGTRFQLRYRDKDRRVWRTLAVTTYAEALIAAKAQELELFQRDLSNYNHSTPITKLRPKPEFQENVTPAVLPVAKPIVRDGLGEAIDRYMKNIKVTGRKNTVRCYENLFRNFYDFATEGGMVARTLKSITEDDLIGFVAYLQGIGNSEVTIHVKSTIIHCLLRANKITDVRHKTTYEVKEVVSYSAEEINQLFAAATPSEKLLFSFFLCTGAREMEVVQARWDQIDFKGRLFTIRQTASFKTKTKKVRYVPLPEHLVNALRQKLLNSTGDLIFPRTNGEPDTEMRYKLFKLHERAGLPRPRGTVLHRWRKSFATQLARHGADVKTISKLLGHESLETTQRYLESEDGRSERSRAQADSTFGVFA